MKRLVIIAIHIGYWGMYFLLLTMMFMLLTISQVDLRTHLSAEIVKWLKIMTPFAIVPGLVGFYGGYSFLYPKYLAKKKIGWFFFLALITSIAGAIISTPTVSILFPENSIEFMSRDGIIVMGIVMTIMAAINLVIGTIIRGFITSYEDIQLKEELTRHNTKIELALIKSHINPHFLFNTINNIDVLIEKNSRDASLYLNKLSQILRFMLYEAKEEAIPFAIEYEHIQRYIELQKIRTTIDNYVVVDTVGSPDSIQLYPLIFMPFIENAFKYAEHKKGSEAIKISWKIDNHAITFHCENTYSVKMNEHHAKKEGGIGNALIKKRLQVLYPSKHELITEHRGEKYHVELTIQTT